MTHRYNKFLGNDDSMTETERLRSENVMLAIIAFTFGASLLAILITL